MSQEYTFIAALRALATHPAARGLADDAAVFDGLVYTHDMIVEGVHYLATDPPADVAWKLLAVNLSDLAAKGATPIAVLMGYALTGDALWDAAFVAGLGEALAHFNVALIGGDTVALPPGAPRVLGLTAIGRAGTRVPSRGGAQVGDAVYVTGVIGDAGLGLRVAREPNAVRPEPVEGSSFAKQPREESAVLRQAQDERDEISTPLQAYRRPNPQLAAGQALAPIVSAMMDVSDGLLIDAQRMAASSGVAFAIDLDAVPLSNDYVAHDGADRAARIAAATAGDDYQLLFTSAAALPALPCAVTRIGTVMSGAGVTMRDAQGVVPPPDRLGWEH